MAQQLSKSEIMDLMGWVGCSDFAANCINAFSREFELFEPEVCIDIPVGTNEEKGKKIYKNELKRLERLVIYHVRSLPTVLYSIQSIHNDIASGKYDSERLRKSFRYLPNDTKKAAKKIGELCDRFDICSWPEGQERIDLFFRRENIENWPREQMLNVLKRIERHCCISIEEHMRQYLRLLIKIVAICRLKMRKSDFYRAAFNIMNYTLASDLAEKYSEFRIRDLINQNDELSVLLSMAVDGVDGQSGTIS